MKKRRLDKRRFYTPDRHLLGCSAVNVFQSYNVIFSYVVTALYFYKYEINHAGITKAVLVACADKCRFISVEHDLLLIIDH